MNGLYKGKYLIAIYDKEGFIRAVCDSPAEVISEGIYKSHAIYAILSKLEAKKLENKRIKLIDCTPQHDCFEEEDKLFLQFIEREKPPTATASLEAQRLGVSIRTYFRHKTRGTLYKLENKLRMKNKIRSDL